MRALFAIGCLPWFAACGAASSVDDPLDAGNGTDSAVADSGGTDSGIIDAGCTQNACGTPPLIHACANGQAPAVTCEAQAGGACGWSISPCPSDGETGAFCGGIANFPCRNPSDFCDIPESEACGTADGSGFCKTRPTACAEPAAAVCGCDGVTYDNACEAARAGSSIKSSARGCK